MDINFFINFNDNNINSESISIGIFGYILNYDEIKYIDSFEYLDEIKNTIIEGKYDPCIKSGLISFSNIVPKDETIKKDIYYLFRFKPNPSNSDFSVEMFIDSKNQLLFNLPKNKYIRGSFNLNNKEIQTKTFSVQLEEEYNFNNNSKNDTYILEFSSNLEDIKPIFYDDFNYSSKKKIGGVYYYYFSTENLSKMSTYNFTIQFNNTIYNKDNKNTDHILKYIANYIIKFYKEVKNQNLDFIIDKTLEYKNISTIPKKFTDYNFTIKSKSENMNLGNKLNYSYYIRLYLKESVFQPQILNTTGFIFHIEYDMIKYTTDNPNEDVPFSFGYLPDNKKYVLHVFIKVNGENNEERYFSTYFEMDTHEKIHEISKNKSNTKTIILISSIFGFIFIITLVIFIIVCIIFKNKNKNLKEQVQAISFSRGIDEDNLNKINRKISKEDEDYENTFI